MKRILLIVVVLAVCSTDASPKERDFVMPALVPATAMGCRDVHRQEKVAFAADAYSTQQKASMFRVAMLQHSVLPILVVFTNDGDEPVWLSHARFELVTRDRAKAEPFSIEDLRRALTALRAPRSRAQDNVPLPLPGKNRVHGGVSGRDLQELQRTMFAARAIEPHSSQQGFLYFDTTGLDQPAQGARLYVTGAADAHGNELMYFEVPLDEPASGQPGESQ